MSPTINLITLVVPQVQDESRFLQSVVQAAIRAYRNNLIESQVVSAEEFRELKTIAG